MLASNFGNFFVISSNFISISGQELFISISINLILLSAKGTLSKVPGASIFLWIDFAISTSGEIITSMGKFSFP